jgi:hypothetical protein
VPNISEIVQSIEIEVPCLLLHSRPLFMQLYYNLSSFSNIFSVPPTSFSMTICSVLYLLVMPSIIHIENFL